MTNRQKSVDCKDLDAFRSLIEDLYIDWFRNFLTVPRFAEYYGLTEAQAHRVIKTGRKLNHRRPILCRPVRAIEPRLPSNREV